MEVNHVQSPLPYKVVKCGLNSIVGTLLVKSNFCLWSKLFEDKCDLCTSKETFLYVLNYFPVMLQQVRYTKRHDNVLSEK